MNTGAQVESSSGQTYRGTRMLVDETSETNARNALRIVVSPSILDVLK